MIRLTPGVAGIKHVMASWNKRKWFMIGYIQGSGPLFGTPLFSDFDPEDRQYLLNELWQQIPQRPVYLCPKPKNRNSWTENDSTTSRTVDLLSSRLMGSGTSASAR